MPYFTSEYGRVYHGDCLDVLRELPSGLVNCCVTSPPYWGLRDYGVDGQLGLEPTPEEYVNRMVEIFREVRRVLRDDGTLWLNLGDTYAAGGLGHGSGKQITNFGSCNGSHIEKARVAPAGFKQKDLIGIPWLVAFALRLDGWYLRRDIIWSKPNPMPESVKDRPTTAHEYIFLMSKNLKYFYDADAIKDPVAASTVGRGPVDFGGKKGREYKPEKPDPNYLGGSEQWGRTFDYKSSCKNGVNKRSVWVCSTRPFPEAHFAVFPTTLIEPCILAGCPEGGIVLDPFFGSGTTGVVSYRNGRNFVGIELSEAYLKDIAIPRIRKAASQRRLFAV